MAFISVLAVFSFLATSAGFYYRTHYFILLMPAAAMLGCRGIERSGDASQPFESSVTGSYRRRYSLCSSLRSAGSTKKFLF